MSPNEWQPSHERELELVLEAFRRIQTEVSDPDDARVLVLAWAQLDTSSSVIDLGQHL